MSDRIPAPLPDDPEDVSWALSTAEAMWSRGERTDALKWLRRAAEAASEAEADDRALELAKAAAELANSAESTANEAAAPTADNLEPDAVQVAPPTPRPELPKERINTTAAIVSPGGIAPPRAPTPLGTKAAIAPRPLSTPPPAPVVAKPGPPNRPMSQPRMTAPNLARQSVPKAPLAPRAVGMTTLSSSTNPSVPRAAIPPPVVEDTRFTSPEVTQQLLARTVADEDLSGGTDQVDVGDADVQIESIPRAPQTSPKLIMAQRLAHGGATVPPPDSDDELPETRDAFQENKTRIGAPAYRGDTEATASPRVRASQAVRVVVWRAQDGVHVAPYGTRVSAISVDAFLVAMDPQADLSAWLNSD